MHISSCGLKPKVEDFPCIDARKLKALGFFTTDLPTLEFPGCGAGRIKVTPLPPAHAQVELSTHGPSGSVTTSLKINLDSTDCHLGGTRPWLICPECRIRRIALLVDRVRVACRCCLGVKYRVQSMGPHTRLERRRERLEAKLAFAEDGFPERPYRMRWTTYNRLWEEYSRLAEYRC